ncbi:alpha-amylase family glycosyl hydrolase [Carboxylicivirga sp. N1Y90]|uniref:alpha-amylase family glycosyl hydrolase n=1 Tax=Carboxylicivirga fragile TaxID=3417571 RepID=UPI003D34F206|nr:cyclomaltodextrinase C-terminal domain-containing protein [Marinilabiliaceae bacterium N1Y90]
MKLSFKTIILLICFYVCSININARNIDVKLQPNNWWKGMKYSNITIVAESSFSNSVSVSINHPGIKVVKSYPGENFKYQFIEISIDEDVATGTFPIRFFDSNGNKGIAQFSIQNRIPHTGERSLSSSDIIYQIVPDRFSNRDTKNDKINGYFERVDRLNPIGIHGGDLLGITSNLEYLERLGITYIDLLPVVESNLMMQSYQRNGGTNWYQIDKRLGNRDNYLQLISESHKRGLKVMQTMVFHQIGKQHPWYIQPPFKDFYYHSEDKYLDNSNAILSDPYQSDYDKNTVYAAWQEMSTPSYKQSNPLLRKLLIQNAIWWIESSGIDALKIDHIAHNNVEFLNELFIALADEYPSLPVIGDNKSAQQVNTAYWQEMALTSQLNNIHAIDYPIAIATSDAFSDFREGQEGLDDVYQLLCQDYTYKNANNNIVMADNHNLTRAFSNADKDLKQLTMMMGLVLTTRGILSILYGTECLLDGTVNKGLGHIRKDMPGGWDGDSKNAFNQTGLSSEEKDFQNLLKQLINWRKQNSDLFTGSFKHFRPEENTYAYYRHKDNKAVLVIINNGGEQRRIKSAKYNEILKHFSSGYDIVTNQEYTDFDMIISSPKSILILHLK